MARKRLPPDVVQQWPDVLKDIDIDVVPVEASDMLPPSVLQARRDQNNAS